MPLQVPLGTIADEFHVASSNLDTARRIRRSHEVNYSERVRELVRTAPLHLEERTRVALDLPGTPLEATLEEAIVGRRSGRRFGDAPMSPSQLARLLYLANGVRSGDSGATTTARNAPTAGGLGSVEIYCFALRVGDVEPGLYHFDSVRHDLALVQAGDFSRWLQGCVFSQLEFSEASAVLVLTSAMGRLQEKYGLRGYRLGLLDAGHVSQNVYLAGSALGLDVCACSGFTDAALNRALELDGLDRCAVLAIGVGTRAAE